ncbi:hypothetical protein, partial [Azotobacter salinestris]
RQQDLLRDINPVNGCQALGSSLLDLAQVGVFRGAHKGLLETPAIRVSTANPTFRWRVDIVLGNTGEGASGDLVVKVGAVEFRPVEDPRALVGYTAG